VAAISAGLIALGVQLGSKLKMIHTRIFEIIKGVFFSTANFAKESSKIAP